MDGKRVGLALGGGAVRGFAHVGVLRVLEREGIEVDCVAGTSIGSVVGLACAVGLTSQQIHELALRFRWRDIGRPVWPRQGFFTFARLEAFLIDVLGDLTFGDLEKPFAAVATDLATGEQVILRQGRVAPAVRASCSVPGLVVPVPLEGRILVDGGIVNSLPISVVRGLGADVVIAVGLHSPSAGYPSGPFRIGIAAIEYLIVHAGDDPADADIHMPIPARGLRSLAFTSHRDRLVSMGERVAEQALPEIRAALGEKPPEAGQDGSGSR